MTKETKIFLGSLVFFLLLLVGLAFLMGGKKEEPLTEVKGIQISPENYEMGEVPINGGIVTKDYEVKNITGETLKLKKIATSCMCTEAKVSLGERETKFFGMEHPGDRNPPINLEISAGESAKVRVNFNPAEHGPEGVGPFERVVWLTFTDPAGIKEIKFEGRVVSQ